MTRKTGMALTYYCSCPHDMLISQLKLRKQNNLLNYMTFKALKGFASLNYKEHKSKPVKVLVLKIIKERETHEALIND